VAQSREDERPLSGRARGPSQPSKVGAGDDPTPPDVGRCRSVEGLRWEARCRSRPSWGGRRALALLLLLAACSDGARDPFGPWPVSPADRVEQDRWARLDALLESHNVLDPPSILAAEPSPDRLRYALERYSDRDQPDTVLYQVFSLAPALDHGLMMVAARSIVRRTGEAGVVALLGKQSVIGRGFGYGYKPAFRRLLAAYPETAMRAMTSRQCARPETEEEMLERMRAGIPSCRSPDLELSLVLELLHIEPSLRTDEVRDWLVAMMGSERLRGPELEWLRRPAQRALARWFADE